MMKLKSKYVDRAITTTLSVCLGESAAVAFLGTRQVGKTTLARDIASDLNARPLRGDRAWYLDLKSDRDPAQLMLAHLQGVTVNLSQLANSLGLNVKP